MEQRTRLANSVFKDEIRSEKLLDKYFRLMNNKRQTHQIKRHRGVNSCVKKVVKKLGAVCRHREGLRQLYSEVREREENLLNT